MTCRGIRGAIGVDANDAEAIVAGARRLLEEIVASNGVAVEDVAGVIFAVTSDLNAAYPARAARDMGWIDTPLLCTQDIHVDGGLPRCIRVLVLWNTDRSAGEIRHVYLGAARALRPDLMEEEGT